MMRFVRRPIGTLLASTLLTLSIGLQVLEATGRWDRTFQDVGDEAIIVTVVLCIGAAVAVANVARRRIALSPLQAAVVVLPRAPLELPLSPLAYSFFDTSPPLSLRI